MNWLSIGFMFGSVMSAAAAGVAIATDQSVWFLVFCAVSGAAFGLAVLNERHSKREANQE